MIAKPVVLGLLAAACVTAAAGGAYVAVRQNETSRRMNSRTSPSSSAAMVWSISPARSGLAVMSTLPHSTTHDFRGVDCVPRPTRLAQVNEAIERQL